MTVEDAFLPPGWMEAGDRLGEGIRLVFTDREGGCSDPPYCSLNLSYSTGDEEENVRRNRERAASLLGVEPSRMVFLRQVHGTNLVKVDDGWNRRNPPEADGAFTDRPGVVLCVLTADCLPVALAAPGGWVALVHAGWRGTLGNISGKAVKLLEREAAVGADRFRAVIGPGIGPCCYRVEEKRAVEFRSAVGEETVVTREEGCFLDLFRANVLNLVKAGLREENIHVVEACTCCEGKFFSHRREGVTGRQGSFLYIVP